MNKLLNTDECPVILAQYKRIVSFSYKLFGTKIVQKRLYIKPELRNYFDVIKVSQF